MNSLSNFVVNKNNTSYGTIESTKVSQADPMKWNLEVRFVREKLASGSIAKGSGYGPNASELNVRMMSMPLEEAKHYRKWWNHNLYATKRQKDIKKADVKVLSEAKLKDDKITGTDYEYDSTKDDGTKLFYAWGKGPYDLPSLKNNKTQWYLVANMGKPGVESFDMPVYELTERSKHISQKSAQWAITKKAGRIADPTFSDFDLKTTIGGDWLCQGGSIAFNGKYWIATCTYLHSGDRHGWDEEIYKDEVSNQSNIWYGKNVKLDENLGHL